MMEPLPNDVIEKVHRDFSDRADIVMELLLGCRRLRSSDYFGDRLIRCVVFAANGDESRVNALIELGRFDYRDLIMAAGYEPKSIKHMRYFGNPFGSEDLG